MTHQHEIDAGATKLVDQDKHFASGQAEDALDAGVGDQFGGDCGSSGHAVVRAQYPDGPDATGVSPPAC